MNVDMNTQKWNCMYRLNFNLSSANLGKRTGYEQRTQMLLLGIPVRQV